MNEYTLKFGAGTLYGVSNNLAQPGKVLWLYDGEIILGTLRLDEAFPARMVEIDGMETFEPGVMLNVVFTRALHVQTDGEHLEFAWF